MARFLRLLFCLFILVFTHETYAQKIDIKLDYTITYLLPKTNDTISFSIANQGKYLYTDSGIVADIFKSQFIDSFGNYNNDNTNVKLLLKLADLEMLFSLSSGKTGILMNLNLIDFLPKKDSVSDEITQLVTNKKTERISLMMNEYSLYEMYTKSESEDKLIFAFDENYPINYKQNFSGFFKYLLGNNINLSIPNGIVVYIKNKKNEEVVRAINIEGESRELSADLNFYIK